MSIFFGIFFLSYWFNRRSNESPCVTITVIRIKQIIILGRLLILPYVLFNEIWVDASAPICHEFCVRVFFILKPKRCVYVRPL